MAENENDSPAERERPDADSLDLQERYGFALQMYKQQHTRWYQWAVFFFGSIAAVFVIQERAAPTVPLWLAASAAAVLSFIWTLAGIAIRRQTYSWELTLKTYENLESPSEKGPFTVYDEELNKQKLWDQVRNLLQVSVTRLLVLTGIFSTILFAITAFWATDQSGDPTEQRDFFLSGSKREVREQLKDVQIWLNEES